MSELLFLDPATNQIYSYPGNGSLSSSVPKTYTSLTQAQADAIRNPILTLDQQKTAQKASLTNSYNVAIQQPVSYMKTTFQADLDSQLTLNKVITALAGSVPNGFYWVDASNNKVIMTFPQLQGLASTMMLQGWVAFENLQNKKAAVDAAPNGFDIEQITW